MCCRVRRSAGIVVNVAELRMYYFPAQSGPLPEGVAPGSRRVITHPISIGRMDWSTPLGVTTITGKVANPSWYPPQSIRDEHAARNDILPRVVPPGPDNPLGLHAMRLGLPGYLIHGTNKPSGVGMRVTHGCVRMFPEDIEALYKTVPTGTSVNIVNQPVKIGWKADGTLYLEAHPALMESNVDGEAVSVTEVVDAAPPVEGAIQESPLTSLMRAYIAATEERHVDLDWDTAERIAQFGNGIPRGRVRVRKRDAAWLRKSPQRHRKQPPKKNRQRVAVCKRMRPVGAAFLSGSISTSPATARTCDPVSDWSRRSRPEPPAPLAEPDSRCSERPKQPVVT